MIKKNIVTEMETNGYLLVNHDYKFGRKNVLLNSNNLANYFLRHYAIKKIKKIKKITSSNSLSQKSLYEKFNFLKNQYPEYSSKLYNMIQNDTSLTNHYNDKNIIKTLKILFKNKNIFKLAQAMRIDLSPKYHHALKWHQDFFDFLSMKTSGISLNINYKDSYTVWSPFTKADQNVGTMEVLVGSHKYGRHNHYYEKAKNKKKSNYSVADTLELKVPKNILNKCKKKIININKSQSIIFSMNLIHRTVIGKSKGIRLTGWGRFTSTNSSSFKNIVKYF
jgi:ectoine hydroxylase-related dioxygenase (phytanoyl-CoA dioxygenase family)|tara:strand:- start:3405 stop:4238 length:834 start_codon:yes stop_codon:yes gene_type:complete